MTGHTMGRGDPPNHTKSERGGFSCGFVDRLTVFLAVPEELVGKQISLRKLRENAPNSSQKTKLR
jgi:hypothetical protein